MALGRPRSIDEQDEFHKSASVSVRFMGNEHDIQIDLGNRSQINTIS